MISWVKRIFDNRKKAQELSAKRTELLQTFELYSCKFDDCIFFRESMIHSSVCSSCIHHHKANKYLPNSLKEYK